MPTPRLRLASMLLCAAALLDLVAAVPAIAEEYPLPMSALVTCPFQLEVTVLSIEEKVRTPEITNIWHRVRVERVMVGRGLKPGDETAVVSQIFDNIGGPFGSSGDRGPFKGPRGLPIKGDRARIFADGTRSILKTRAPNGWQLAEPCVAFVAAEDQYRSAVTMPFLARLVTEAHVARTQVMLATADDGVGFPLPHPEPAARTCLTDCHALRFVDGTVLFMSERQLEGNCQGALADATTFELPLVGFRTALRPFAYPGSGPGVTHWNEEFPLQHLGARLGTDYGSSSHTRILPPDAEAAEHPVLRGLTIPAEGLLVPGCLYHIKSLAPDCRVLLWGEPVGSPITQTPPRQPLLWVRELPRKDDMPPRRIAFTTLGDPGDFAVAEVRLIAVQMIGWALRQEAMLNDSAHAAIRAAQFDASKVK